MFDGQLGMYITAAITAIASFLGFYAKLKQKEVRKLEVEKKSIEESRNRAMHQIKMEKRKNELHKEVAKRISENSQETQVKVQEMQKKIDKVEDGEEIIIVI